MSDLCEKNVKNTGLISTKVIDFLQNLLKNNHKIHCFFTDCFLVKFSPENSREIVPKNPAKFDFFFCDLSEALIYLSKGGEGQV